MPADTTAARFSKNIWSLALSQIVYRLATIVVFGYIGQYLGVGVLGQYAIVMGVLNLYLSFSDLGVSNFVIKEVSQNRSLGELYLDNFFVLQIVVGLVIVGLAILTGEVYGYSAIIMWGIAIGSIGLVFNGMANAYKALLSAQERLFPFAVIEAVCMIVYVAGNLLVIVFRQGLLELIGVTVAVKFVKYAMGAIWSRRYNTRVKFRVDAKIVRTMLRLGIPFLLFNSAHFAIQRLDVLIIGSLDTETASGLYAAASRLVYSSLFVISVIGTALYPVFSRLLHEQRARVPELYYQATSYVYIIAALAGLTFYVLAPSIIQLIFREGFDTSVTVLRIIAWYIPAFAAGLFASNILMVGNNVWSAARVSVTGVLIMVTAVIALYPRFGIQGVAVTVVTVEALLTVLYLALVKKHFKLLFLRTRVLPATAVLAAAIAVHWLVPAELEIVRVAAPLLIFGTLLFTMRILRISDVSIIMNILLKRTSPLS